MRRWTRALTTLLAASAAGFLLWFAPHFNRWTTGGYWGLVAVVALAGLLVGLSQLHARDGNPAASFLLAFVPVFVAAGWVIVALEPRGNWVRDHVLTWSGEIGIGHAVHNLGEHVLVLAFALGIVFGLTFEPRMVRRRARKAPVPAIVVVTPSPEPAAAGPGWEEPTAVGPPPAEAEEDAAATVETDRPRPQPPPADHAESEEEPTVVAAPVERPPDEAAPTAEAAPAGPEPRAADEEPTVVEAPAAEAGEGELGPARPPA